MKNIEVNGPANIIMILDAALDAGEIDPLLYKKLCEQAWRTISYLRQLDNPKQTKWADIQSPLEIKFDTLVG